MGAFGPPGPAPKGPTGRKGNRGAQGGKGPVGPPSDLRLKENIETSKFGIGTLSKLKGVTFQWNQDNPMVKKLGKKGTDIGFIAQDVEKIVPELVFNWDGDYLGVEYPLVSVMAMKSLQESNEKISIIMDRINRLKEVI